MGILLITYPFVVVALFVDAIITDRVRVPDHPLRSWECWMTDLITSLFWRAKFYPLGNKIYFHAKLIVSALQHGRRDGKIKYYFVLAKSTGSSGSELQITPTRNFH